MHKVKAGRTLSDSLREVARAMDDKLLGGKPLRHDRNAIRILKRLAMAEARRLEDARAAPKRCRHARLFDAVACDGDTAERLAQRLTAEEFRDDTGFERDIVAFRKLRTDARVRAARRYLDNLG